jgi:hypothetical protein
MSLSMLPMLADDDISAIVKLIFFVAFIVVTVIVKALKQQAKNDERLRRRPYQAEEQQQELPEIKPNLPPGQAPPRLSVEDVALAMRRAQHQRYQQQRQAAQQARQGQAVDPRAAQIHIAQQRAAQAAAQQRAAQERARQQAAQMRTAQQRQVTVQSAQAGQPLARPLSRAGMTHRQVQDVQAVTISQSAEATESVEQRHLRQSTVGQGVEAEEARLRGRLQDEDTDRARRFDEESLGRLHHAAAVVPVRAVSALGEMHLNTPAEIGRAVLYAEIIGLPLALRELEPTWES